MESHRLSTQRIMCIFSLIKNFFLYASTLRRQPHYREQTLTHLSQVLFSLTYAKWKLNPNTSWTAFPTSRARPRDPMAWLTPVPIWRGVYHNGQQQYAQFRVRRWTINVYMIFRNWWPPTNWHQAHDGMLHDKYWRVRRLTLLKNTLLIYIPQGLRSTSKLDRCVLSNPWWFDEFAKHRGKRTRATPLMTVNQYHTPVHIK